jgi:hypothetical protein
MKQISHTLDDKGFPRISDALRDVCHVPCVLFCDDASCDGRDVCVYSK